MKRSVIVILALVLTLCLSLSVYAAETIPEFYRKSLSDDLPGRKGDLSDIEKEIKDQAQAVLTSLKVDAERALADFSLDNAVRMVVNRGSSQDAYEGLKNVAKAFYDDYFSTLIDKDDYTWLEYGWKVPVAEHENGYVFAMLVIHSEDDISISTGFTPNKDYPNVRYLFDRELVTSIINDSGVTANYDEMLPLSLTSLYTDVVIFSTDSGLKAIPFSARADLLGIVNGSVYDLDDFTTIIGLYVQSQGGAFSESSGGGGGGSVTDTVAPEKGPDIGKFVLPTVVTVAVACFVYWRITKKRQNRM